MDERGWGFSFADADTFEDTFDVFAAGFRELGMLKRGVKWAIVS